METFTTEKDIFSVGTWNGDKYTLEDLDDMVANFNKLKAEEKNFRVPLKVNFFKPENVVKGSFHGGVPAVGWIEDMYRNGEKLFARIVEIPRVVKDLIDKKAFRQVSAEMVWNMKHNAERLRRVITGVALLGVETPGVGNLDEFAKLYGLELKEGEIVKEYITQQEETLMTPEEIKKLLDQLAASEKAAQEAKDYAAKLDAEKKDLEVKVTEADQKMRELADGQRKEEIKNFVTKASTEGKILPKHVAAVTSILEGIEVSKTVKFTADGKEQEVSVNKLFCDFINELPKLVEFKEKTEEVELPGADLKEFVAKPELGDEKAQKLDFLIKAHCKKNEGMDYATAYSAVAKEHPELV
jgi:hypothetical protein